MDDIISQVIEELHSVVVALVAGARYGTRIRLPHAMLMTFLFKKDLSTQEKLKAVFKLVKEHATNLAAFAAIYKVILACLKWISRHLQASSSSVSSSSIDSISLLRRLGRTVLITIIDGPLLPGEQPLLIATAPAGHPERSHHALFAGAIGGYLIWGRYSSVNYQVVLYLASRVLVGLWKRYGVGHEHPLGYRFAAAAVWGVVMMLFEECPEVLHPSLKSSMDEIYRFGLPPRTDSRLSDSSGRRDDSRSSSYI